MPKVEGLNKVLDRFKQLDKQVARTVSVIVGYTQQYAVFVHEDLTKRHPVGQAKFLEQPARELSRSIGEGVRKAIKEGASVDQALLIQGLRIQRESQLLCPVETGALKASAFTMLES